MSKPVQLEESWRKHLLEEFDKDYMKSLKLFLKKDIGIKIKSNHS